MDHQYHIDDVRLGADGVRSFAILVRTDLALPIGGHVT